MSARSLVSFAGFSKLRARLAELAVGLRAAASGEVTERAAAKVADQVRRVAASKLAQHNMTGLAAANTVVDQVGALVQLHGMPPCNGKAWERKSYLSTFGWWPFRSGKMPPFIISNAVKIFEAELAAALSGKASPLAVAAEAEEESAAAKSRVRFKKEIARIYRQSAEGKARRAAEAKVRSEDRAHDKRVKAFEDREGR